MKTQATTLSNGLKVVTSTIPGAQSAALGIWVGVGGRHECRTLTGISHFIEHMLFKGTTQRSAREITRAIEGRGGYFNAFTQEESTCYYARMAGAHLWDVLEVITDMYLRPRFAPDDIVREKGVILEELLMINDQPEQLVQEMLSAMLWRNHELGRPLTGTPETLQRLNRDRLTAFKNKKYVPENTLCVFAGPAEHTECVEKVKRMMRRVPRKTEPTYRLVTSAVGQDRIQVRVKDIEQTHLALGFRLFGRFDKRRFALRLLNVVLGENMSSRLFQTMREKYGMAYAVHSTAQLFAETGALVISAGVDADRTEKAVEILAREIRNLKKNPISRRELMEAREYVIGHLLLSLESPSGHMHWLGESMLNYGRIVPPEEVVAALGDITADDAYRVAGDVFRRNNFSLAVLTGRDAKITEKQLREIMNDL